MKTLREIVDLIAYLRTASTDEKGAIKEKLRRSSLITSLSSLRNDDKRLDAALDLAARLYLMVSIGSLQQSITPGRMIPWDDGPLAQKVHTTLWPQPQLSEQVKLPKSFTAANLERIAGIKIIWTSNLADHLTLTNDDTRLILFHQISFLELHKTSKRYFAHIHPSPETSPNLPILPRR